ncbi:MAG: carbon dioxide concentrating mechanism protein CcmL [Planctomycetaceae bacterium]|jgi:ethanolamine utilization protein EutN|nr:carbon dioxide concentrating mechanism protein CcmL [Planctomycetaceae bacterium]
MRIGKVIGSVTLSRCNASVNGSQWKIAVPMTEDALRRPAEPFNAEELIVYDSLSVTDGQLIAFSEGAEASKPFYPNPKPLDAYCAAILDTVEIDKGQ